VLPLFSTAWADLDPDAVRAFLADAGEEGVTWEAKADDKRGKLHPESLRKAACGFANRDGGYIIVGAKRDAETGEWTLPGIRRPAEEPELWIGQVLRALRPTPRAAPHAWPLDDGRIAAVVWIEPVDEPPCMTPQGQVYERVSGATVPVTDPARLDALFRGGQQARARAEYFANRAASRALDEPRWFSQRAVGVAVALASVGRQNDDIASRLFVASFRDAMGDALTQLFRTADPVRGRDTPEGGTRVQQQDALSMTAPFLQGSTADAGGSGRRLYSEWRLQATWDGAVAASAALSPEAVEELMEHGEIVRPAWEAVVPLVERLGGSGSAQLAVRVYAAPDLPASMPLLRNGAVIQRPPPPPRGTLFARMSEHTLIGRWTAVADPDPDMLASVCRELQRAAGREALEPEPPAVADATE
jgi:hypothetical protein